MAETLAHWQFKFEKVEQRCGHLLQDKLWTDCTFVAGSEKIQAHKLILATSSPVFEQMFYGEPSSDRNKPINSNVQPEAFKALLEYIYTGKPDINSLPLDIAFGLLDGAKKYELPHLVKQCNRYICSALAPGNVGRGYELACLYDEETLVEECIQIITTNTKDVLNDSSFDDLILNTVITVCSLNHLNVDSELDLFHAVAKYAKAEQRRLGRISTPVDGTTTEEKNAESSSVTSPAAEPDVTPPTEELTSEPTCDKQHLEEVPEGLRLSLRAAIEKIRFLSLSAQEFAAGPARSGLLTRDESFAVLMNIASTKSVEPMPTGFSKYRERRQPRNDSELCFEAGSLDHTIHALKCGDPSKVTDAAWAAGKILEIPRDIQQALDKGILDALVPALNEKHIAFCKFSAAYAIGNLCILGSPSQLSALAASAALEPYCRLMTSRWSNTCGWVLRGLRYLLKNVEENTKVALLRKLREIGVPQLLIPVQRDQDADNHEFATDLLGTYFDNEQ